MAMRQSLHPLLLLAGLLIGLLLLAGVTAIVWWPDGRPHGSKVAVAAPATQGLPMAVLGDSLSHAYQDPVNFAPGASDRGGPWHASSLQWTEALQLLRGNEIDMGPWEVWGRPGVVARARELMGLSGGRAFRKADYRYNFANSGAGCKNLNGGRFRQTPRLLALMQSDAARWQSGGVVVIRIGLNDWGGLLDLQSREPEAAQLKAVAARCIDAVGEAVRVLQADFPALHFVLVGYLNEADDPAEFAHWRSAEATRNIGQALTMFNAQLRDLAARLPYTRFFDDRAWFAGLWGTRAANGDPDYKTVQMGSLTVRNTRGDAPQNAVMADRHPGLMWNLLWAQAMAAQLHAQGLPVTPVSDAELRRLLTAQIALTPQPLPAETDLRAPGS